MNHTNVSVFYSVLMSSLGSDAIGSKATTKECHGQGHLCDVMHLKCLLLRSSCRGLVANELD